MARRRRVVVARRVTRGERERRIAAVRVRAVDIVLERPVETAGGTMTTAPLVLVDVRTDDGIVDS